MSQTGLREMAETAARAERERDALAEQLAAERRRREEAEARLETAEASAVRLNERYALRDADAQRAELERDEANARALTMCRVQDEAMAAQQRAEADNAALLRRINNAGHAMGMGHFDTANDILCRAAAGVHPGAALLGRMRALEALASAVREYLNPGPNREHNLFPVRNALAAVDAMKAPNE